MEAMTDPADIVTLRRHQLTRKMRLRVAALAGIVVVALLAPLWPAWSAGRLAIQWLGMLAIFVCIAGRTWCSLYIGPKKVRELVTIGPYSVTRNPLYVFSVIGATGVGASFGSLVIALVAGAIVLAVFNITVEREEHTLAEVHGDAFRRYTEQVPRFWPRFSAWRDVPTLTIGTRATVSTFIDSLYFLAALPAALIVQWLQTEGWIQPLLRLP
jgi:protein-S-isoprenylcysteine O-methyltransferase Ste14